MQQPTSPEALFTRAAEIIPGGVDSPVRAFGSVGGTPPFISRAKGAVVTDTTGREYLDLVGSWGPALLGHAHPEVVSAVQKAAADGLSFGAPTVAEVELAEAIRFRVPPAEKVRLVSTGTEATMTAIRLARGATKRDLIVKFAGCYHGHSDSLLVAAGSGLATVGQPDSAGIPAPVAAQTIVLPYNDIPALEAAFAAHGPQIAGVITEAAPCNMGVITPGVGFNEAVRRITAEYGALMILDEVLTGFRVGPAGWWGLESGYNAGQTPSYTPDLFTFGKVIGGGMPLAALGGARKVMDLLAPLGPVYQAGTLSGNPLATAAGLATLRLADSTVYDRIDVASAVLSAHLSQNLFEAEVPHWMNQAGSLFSVFFGEAPTRTGVSNYVEAQAQNAAQYAAFFHSLLQQGVYLPPSCFEAWFISAAHDGQVVDAILEALPEAVAAAKAVGTPT